MNIRKSEAIWEGSLKDGKGTMTVGSGAYQGAYTWASRFENASGTNPEELIAAAHAGCFSMALSGDLGKAGYKPNRVSTRAMVTMDIVEGKARITRIQLETEASIPGISNDEFQKISQGSKEGCPVSVALANVPISLTARLV